MYVQLNSLSERTLEIVNSPEIRTDISAAEINQILNRLRRAGKKREAQDFWSKYYNLVDDGYKRLCESLHLDHTQHVFTKKKRVIQIDGYPVKMWRLLYDDEFVPDHRSYYNTIRNLFKENRLEEALRIITKYQWFDRQEKEEFCRIHGIVTKANFIFYNGEYIDGVPFALWRLFNDEAYIPQKTHLIIWLRDFETAQEHEKAELIRTKFSYILESKRDEKPKLGLEESKQLLRNLLKNPYNRYKNLQPWENNDDDVHP